MTIGWTTGRVASIIARESQSSLRERSDDTSRRDRADGVSVATRWRFEKSRMTGCLGDVIAHCGLSTRRRSP